MCLEVNCVHTHDSQTVDIHTVVKRIRGLTEISQMTFIKLFNEMQWLRIDDEISLGLFSIIKHFRASVYIWNAFTNAKIQFSEYHNNNS